MGIARKFNKLLHDEIRVHAAWLPITNTFEIGDYGVISEGVFTRLGNVSEFGTPEAAIAAGPSSSIDFTSKGASTVRLVADAEVDSLPDTDVSARIRIHFENENSFIVKAQLTSEEIRNKNEVAKAAFQHPEWRSRYKIVTSIFSAENCVFIASNSAGAEVEFGGTAKALKTFELGKVEAGIALTNFRDIGLEVVGAMGALGLRMVRKRWLGLGAIPVEKANFTNLDFETSDGIMQSVEDLDVGTEAFDVEEFSPETGDLVDDV
tara:strand:+ start:3203 stop:3994 length:792 start_codon:yes stop_codon:yes gene_type:complete